jgi:hypothetical protein
MFRPTKSAADGVKGPLARSALAKSRPEHRFMRRRVASS